MSSPQSYSGITPLQTCVDTQTLTLVPGQLSLSPTFMSSNFYSSSSSHLETRDFRFVEEDTGRTVLLRGVNLSASAKAPVGQPSQLIEDFWESGESGDVSFIGRPLSLEDGSADVHLQRLRGWGFNMLRFPVTWEALEHEGPGKYDFEFMDYTVRVLQKCKDYGFKVFMDPHQDIWSRWSGGDGAPFWTLAACGINPRNFTATQAALLHCEFPPNPVKFPAMIWSTNYNRLASQTLFTLFFAGRDFAPKCIIDGVNIQDWLQKKFITAFGLLADRIKEAGDLYDTCIIGWDSMNEPSEGLCGDPDINANAVGVTNNLTKGTRPTPVQSMRLGMGMAQKVENWEFGSFGPKKLGEIEVDPKGKTIWADKEMLGEKDGVNTRWGWKRDPGWKLGVCIWGLHGVWDLKSGDVLIPDYFASPVRSPERRVVFIIDYWKPHFVDYVERIRKSHPKMIAFIQPPVFVQPPPISELTLQGRACYSPHYYDGLTLITRHWNWFNADALGLLRGKYWSKIGAIRIGEAAIRNSLQEQLGWLASDIDVVGQYPTLMGEIGIPFDMDNKRSYGYTDDGKYKGDYREQQKALDASLNACDGTNALNYTLWNYCPDNSHEWGDGWNLEDLSIWSEDDRMKERDLREIGSMAYPPVSSSSSSVSERKSKKPGSLLKAKFERRRAGSAAPLLVQQQGGDAKAASSTTLVSDASASQLSLPIVPGGSASVSPASSKAVSRVPSRLRLNSSWADDEPQYVNAYDFLLDGARAVRAFCRPWPVLTVGKPKSMDFEIYKAEFRMKVLVSSEDQPPMGATDGSGPEDDDGEKPRELATQIYVPLIHYANPNIVLASNCPITAAKEAARRLQLGDDGTGPAAPPWPVIVDQPESKNEWGSQSLSSSSSNTTLVPTACLDLAVRVSEGRWEVAGQYLYWYYPVPKPGEDTKEYMITIRRADGPIKGFRGSCPDSGLSDDPTLCETVDLIASGRWPFPYLNSDD